MIYWWTGQPGHGKTLHAIEQLLEFKAKGRACYVCNVRGFDYEKTGVEQMTPEQFRDWMNFLPDGSVALVDEAYQHKMLPKRAPSTAVPAHVENLAVHRHRGIDFIFVCQSPDTQCDTFTRDLIDWHYHVRRKFGTQWVAIRKFDKYEANAEKATPLTVQRKRLPKAVFGTYDSTELDTTEKRVPWFYWAFGFGVPAGLAFMYWTFSGMGDRLGASHETPPAIESAAQAGTERSEGAASSRVATVEEYISRFMPRIPSQPWSAPAYDDLAVGNEPPRVFCMESGAGQDANGNFKDAGCSCLTEQGTRYEMADHLCKTVAVVGQYEPYYEERGSTRVNGEAQQDEYSRQLEEQNMPMRTSALGIGGDDQQAAYGSMRGKDYPAYTSSQGMK